MIGVRIRRRSTKYDRILHKFYARSTQGLHKVYTRSTQGLRKVYTRFTQGLHNGTQPLSTQCLHKVYTRSTQGLPKVYLRSTQGLRKVYARFTQGLHKVSTRSTVLLPSKMLTFMFSHTLLVHRNANASAKRSIRAFDTTLPAHTDPVTQEGRVLKRHRGDVLEDISDPPARHAAKPARGARYPVSTI